MEPRYFDGYKSTQFLFLIISLDPWSILRGYRLPDELKIYTNMTGYKKKAGDIEVLLIGDKYSGLTEISDFEYIVVNPVFRDLVMDNRRIPATGWLKITIEEESSAVVETDPLGFHPAYYLMYGSDLVFSVREEWIQGLGENVIEVPNNYKAELSYKSTYLIRKKPKKDVKLNVIEVTANYLFEILEGIEGEKILLVGSSPIDIFVIRILLENDLYTKVKFLPTSKKAIEILKDSLKAAGVDMGDTIIIDSEKMGLDLKDHSPKGLIVQLKQKLIEGGKKQAILLLNTLGNEDLTYLANSDKSISQYIEDRKLFRNLRRIFSSIWPIGVADPILFNDLIYIRGRDLWEKIKG